MIDERLENELKSLQLVAPSRRLEAAVANELGPAAPKATGWRAVSLCTMAAGALAAAACLVLAICLWHPRQDDSVPVARTTRGHIQAVESPVSAKLTIEQLKALPPTEWGYEMASHSSPQDVQLYMDHQAEILLPSE
jgi:hypothetical protein